MSVKVFWIENDIDLKYMKPILESIVEDETTKFKVFYRPNKSIFDGILSFLNFINGYSDYLSDEFGCIYTSLKYLRDNSCTVITGYNFNKYTEKQTTGIKFILLGHSHLGPVRYNIISYLQAKFENTFSLVPEYYENLFKNSPGNLKFTSSKFDKSHIRHYKSYYKNIYHMMNPPKVVNDGSILFLPHWSLCISEVASKSRKIKSLFGNKDIKLIVKLHPNLELEILKAMHLAFKDVKDEEGTITKNKAKSLLNKNRSELELENIHLKYASELSLEDAIDSCDYQVFDGGSSTLVESIVRNKLYHNNRIKYVLLMNDYLDNLDNQFKVMSNEKDGKRLSNIYKELDNKCLGTTNFNWTTYSDSVNVSHAYKLNLVNEANLTLHDFKYVSDEIVDQIVPTIDKDIVLNEFISKLNELSE